MGWVDTHCHLHLSAEQPGTLMQRAAAAGVEWVVCPGTDAATSVAARELHISDPDHILWSAGLHPHEAEKWPQEEQRLVELARSANAVGECGLDFYRNLAPRAAQLAAFGAQVDLAQDLEKPLIVHCRDAFGEIFEIIEAKAPSVPVVLHCWTGGPKWTRRFRDLGVVFSFAGPIAFETGDTVRRGAAEAPLESTMVETDTPYLTPPPDRSVANEPARVVTVGSALAEVWGLEPDEVAALTTTTAARTFKK